MSDDDNLLDHQWHQLEDQQREEAEWFKDQDMDESWIQKALRLMKEEARRWV